MNFLLAHPYVQGCICHGRSFPHAKVIHFFFLTESILKQNVSPTL